jgi:hypothetical protein
MAFGLLVTKWRILLSALSVSLVNASKVFNACCILHNFCIDEKLINMQDPRLKKVYSSTNITLGYIPSDIEESASSG